MKMGRDHILRDLEDALKQMVFSQVEESFKGEMELLVEKYFQEKIKPMSVEDLQAKLIEPEDLLNDFSSYISEKGSECVLCYKP